MTDTGPLFVSSGDLIADRRYKWALDHAARGDLSGAAEILAQTVELAPRFATAWFALGAIRDRLGDAHPAMTETYIRRLFDQYAGRYDAALTEHLNYRGPAILRGIVEAAMTGDAGLAAVALSGHPLVPGITAARELIGEYRERHGKHLAYLR